MFETITERLGQVFKTLRGHGKLTEKNISDAMRDVRMALLEADVNFKVVKQFIKDVAERAVGQEVTKSVTPGQQVVKVVQDELDRVEPEIAKLERSLEELNAQQADPATYSDPEKAVRLARARAEIERGLERLYARWEDLARRLP